MSDKSPLFVSALELIAHAAELYGEGKPRNFKFVILHLANAIELILKDRLIDLGVSIYISNKPETINIWKCFSEFESLNIKVAKRPVIELLIDDRNTIQHRFGFPNAEAVYYYLDHVVEFFKTFLTEQYGIALAEALEPRLSKELLVLLGLTTDEFAHLAKLMKLSPEAAVMQAYKDIEALYTGSASTSEAKTSPRLVGSELARVLDVLEQQNIFKPGIHNRFNSLRLARNTAAHYPNNDASDPTWAEALEIAKEILVGLQKARDEGILFSGTEQTNPQLDSST